MLKVLPRIGYIAMLSVWMAACGGGGGSAEPVTGGETNPPAETPAPEVSPDTVSTSCGRYRGEAAGDAVAFRGIAYAEPPRGENRWRPPVTAGCNDAVQETTQFAEACAQLSESGDVLSLAEDCLYLNLWTPETAFPAQERRPVLFFIHGGGNQRGSPSIEQLGVTLYDGEALALAGDTVVVTVGYRLGALGFLSHPALAAENPDGRAGNYGLLDQIEALKWVQRHIAQFGGDPDRVTIFGESGGARDVCALVASPLASGLFHGAIMQSGGCRQRTQLEAEEESREIAVKAGCTSETDSSCLRSLSTQQLLEALGAEERNGAFVGQNIGPVVDDYVLLGSPEAVIAEGSHNQVPLIVGANSEETGFWIKSGGAEVSAEGYATLVRAQFGTLLGNLILEQYPVEDYASPIDAYVALSTDSQFICPARRLVQTASVHSMPVYSYRFAKGFESTPLQRGGAFHGIELFYLFQKVRELADYTATDDDLAVEAQLASYWSSFARSGDPAAASVGEVFWEPYRPEEDRVLWIDAVTEQRLDPRATQCRFWRTLGGG